MSEPQMMNGAAQTQSPLPSAVSRVIALGYYDGPTSGILD